MSAPGWAGSLVERGGRAVLPTYARYPVELASGRGCRVWDSEGREYLDGVAGIAVNVLGHGHPAIVEAIRSQAEGLLHVSNLYWTEPMVRLAERLNQAAGMDGAFFCNSGAEAVEGLLKLARKARPERSRFLCFERSFHGRTLGALSVTAQEKYQAPFRPLLSASTVLPHGELAPVQAALDESVAAVIVEPIQGEGGMRPAPAGFLAGLRELCDRAGALLLFDEVQSGIGRTGDFFAFQGEGVAPDALSTAKALAGGLPMGAVLARGEAARALQPGDHASTFGGGPFVSSVANAVLDVVLSEGFLAGVRSKGVRLASALERLASRHALVDGVRGRGLMQGLVLREPRAGELVEQLRAEGLLTCPAGPDVVRLAPALIASEEELDEMAACLDRALSALASEAGAA